MMFSFLFGVGYVVMRYRKSGFLKRLHATPRTMLVLRRVSHGRKQRRRKPAKAVHFTHHFHSTPPK